MSEILSQDEIDALLTGVDNGDVETEDEVPFEEGEIRQYDFTSQDKIVRGRLPTLEMINERFARNFRISLFNFVRRAPSITINSIRMSKFGDYVNSLFMPSNINIVKIKPLRGSSLFIMNPTLVYTIVDNFFGGNGKLQTKIEGRDFTQTELQVIESVLKMIFEDLKKAWSPIMGLEFEHVGSEINPQFANIISPTEVIVISSFTIELEDSTDELHMAFPYSMFEPIKDQLNAGIQSDTSEFDERWQQLLQEGIKHASLTLKSDLVDIQLSLRELSALQKGDVIPIDMPETVTATIEDVPVFHATYGLSRGNQSLKVKEIIHRESSSVKYS